MQNIAEDKAPNNGKPTKPATPKKEKDPLYEGIPDHMLPKTKGGKALVKLRHLITKLQKRNPIPLPE